MFIVYGIYQIYSLLSTFITMSSAYRILCKVEGHVVNCINGNLAL